VLQSSPKVLAGAACASGAIAAAYALAVIVSFTRTPAARAIAGVVDDDCIAVARLKRIELWYVF
jgi:hypothetical protein